MMCPASCRTPGTQFLQQYWNPPESLRTIPGSAVESPRLFRRMSGPTGRRWMRPPNALRNQGRIRVSPLRPAGSLRIPS